MARRPVSLALVGAGAIGQVHARTVAQHLPGARLAAVVDPDAGRAQQAAAVADGAAAMESAGPALREPAIDAVVIAAPTHVHADLIIEAARNGKHVFCEKPLALTLGDARRAVDAVTAAGVHLQIGFQRRFDAGYRRAKDAIARGELGRVELLASTTRDPAPPRPGYLECCGGVFLDTSIHDFDSIRFLADDEVSEVYATASTLVTPERGGAFDLDTVAVVLRLRSGALATVTNSLRTGYGYEAGAEVFGSRGKITVHGAEDGVRHYREGHVAVAHPQTWRERFGEAYRAELADFVRCVAEGRPPSVDGKDGLRALEVALAATQSQREGRPVRL